MPSPAPAALPPGSVAVTIPDRLPLLSTPWPTSDAVVYRPYLPAGAALLILEGPVLSAGYRWYRVEPISFALDGGATEGWVAEAGLDGTPWISLGQGPVTGLQVAQSAVARAPGSPAKAVAAASSVNALGLDLHRLLVANRDFKDKNVVYSPTSIALALAMARAGAVGDTAREMDAVLHAEGWGSLAAGLSALDTALRSHDAQWQDSEGKPHKLALQIANAAFGQVGLPIEQAYLDAIAAAFGAGLNLVDFAADPASARQTINRWVGRETEMRIPELLGEPDVLRDTRLVLVNAIYLKANWSREFDVDLTVPRAFTRVDGSRVEVPTMDVTGGQDVPYAEGRGWKATELLLAGRDESAPLAMTLVLPDDPAAFEAQLSTATLDGVIARLDAQRKLLARVTYGEPESCGTYAYRLNLFMPRFGIDTRTDLVASLAALGMPRAFDARTADFTGIATPPDGPLYVKKVIHQANIDVDEKGTEAAAATAVVMAVGGCTGPDAAKTITLRLDRPFLFFLRDRQTGAILFVGRVLDPSTRG